MSNRIWQALGVGLVAIFGAQALKAKQKMDDRANNVTTESKAFAQLLNDQLAHTRSVRIPGALTRPEMDPNGEPYPGWSRVVETMPVLQHSPWEDVLQTCLKNEEYYQRFTNSIFCGWVVREESHAPGGTFWRLTQTVFVKNQLVQG